MKYKIVRGATITQLESSVNEHIQAGWTPQGSFTVIDTDPQFSNKQSYGQGLIIESEEMMK